MKRDPTVGVDDRSPRERLGIRLLGIQLLDVGRDVEEALRAEEVASPFSTGAPLDAQILMQRRVRRPRSDGHVPAAALRAEPDRHGNGLDQRGLATAVLSGEKSDRSR